MAANSLLYLLLVTGLTAPPEDAVTTESNLGFDDAYTLEPYGAERQTFRPRDQFTAPPVTEEDVTPYEAERHRRYHEDKHQDSRAFWEEESEYQTDDSRDQFTAPPVTRSDNADLWPLATEEPDNETERPVTLRHKSGKSKCPKREHKSKWICDKTCSNYSKPPPCHKEPGSKRVCVCDGGLVRNKDGTCVPRHLCKANGMAAMEDNHGCPYEFACDVYCVTDKKKKRGECQDKKCICH